MNHETIVEVNTLLAKMQAGISHYAPQAWHTMLVVKQIDSLGTLLNGGLTLLLAIIAWIVCGLCLRAALKFHAETDDYGNLKHKYDMAPAFPGIVVGGVVGLIASIVTFLTLSDIWAWVGVYNPSIAVAHDILVRVLSQ